MIKRNTKCKNPDIIMRIYTGINLWCDFGWNTVCAGAGLVCYVRYLERTEHTEGCNKNGLWVMGFELQGLTT